MKEFWLVLLVALVFAIVVFIVAMGLNKLGWIKSNKLKDEDKDWIPDSVETTIAELRQDLKETKERLQQELSDVGDAIKEVGNQISDVPQAFSGKKRPGRKKKGNNGNSGS
tara:strand:- start:28266 stop:28598 length:333 start_codon:yes stop_codon:yes gene_type:complete